MEIVDQQRPKTVMAMHDICGYGRSSLTVIYPVLCTLGLQVCPLPTALLSHHYGFHPVPSFLNLGKEIEKFIPLWKEAGFSFDAFFSGYLADPTQVDLAFRFMEEFAPTWIYVDPVLGDQGLLYGDFTSTQVEAMRRLIKRAQIISPNVTEACFLLDRPMKPNLSPQEAREMLYDLADFGPRYVTITGVSTSQEKEISIFALEKESNTFFQAISPILPGHFNGAGDVFSSVLLGNLMKGISFPDSVDRAMTYLYKSLKLAGEYKTEICLEPTLPLLVSGAQSANLIFFQDDLK